MKFVTSAATWQKVPDEIAPGVEMRITQTRPAQAEIRVERSIVDRLASTLERAGSRPNLVRVEHLLGTLKTGAPSSQDYREALVELVTHHAPQMREYIVSLEKRMLDGNL